jgi:membrane protease YdiL (CAAX protease family)
VSERADARATRSPIGVLALLGLGCGALVLRLQLHVLPPDARVVALFAIFGAIVVASLLVPVAPGRRRLHPAVALAIGLVAVAAASIAGGRPVPLPLGPWAIPLVVLGAVAEEALFRRAAFGALEPAGPWVAIGITSVAFAAIHLPLYGVAAFPVDLGAGLLFGWQRWASGTWTTSAGTHAAANLLIVMAR